MGADFGKSCAGASKGAGLKASENRGHNVPAYRSADVWGEDTLAAPPAEKVSRTEGVSEKRQFFVDGDLLKGIENAAKP